MADSEYTPLVYREQGGQKLVVKQGGDIWDKQARGDDIPSLVFEHQATFEQATVAAATVTLTPPDGCEIIDAFVEKTGAGSASTASTVQLQTSTGGAISDAMSLIAVDQAIVRAGSLNDALRVIAKGSSYKVVRGGASVGSTAAGRDISAIVHVLMVKRGT